MSAKKVAVETEDDDEEEERLPTDRFELKKSSLYMTSSIVMMPKRARYLLVDGHSVIFAWPELRKLHARRSALAREALVKWLRDYQDWTGVRVVVVFDGKGRKIETTSDPAEVQVYYSRTGQTADAIIERLASKYAKRFELLVATSDSMEGETVEACGAEWISPDALRGLLASGRRAGT